MSNEEDTVSNIDFRPGLGRSDHCCLRFRINFTANRREKQRRFNFPRGKYDEAKAMLLSINWEEQLKDLSVDQSCLFFSQILLRVMEETIPKHRVSAKPNQLYMNRETS